MGCSGSKPNGDAHQKSPNAEPVAPVKEDQVITLKTFEVKVEITKASAEEKIGVTFADPAQGNALRVNAIEDHGAIPSYNASHAPEKQVVVGDQIIAVNKISGDSDRMMQEMATVTELIFMLLRDVSKSVDPPVVASAVPDAATSGDPEPAPEKHPKSVETKVEEGAPDAVESNAVTPEQKPAHEVASALKEGANQGSEVPQQASETTKVDKDGNLEESDIKESDKDDKVDHKNVNEMPGLNENGKDDQNGVEDMLSTGLVAGEAVTKVDPDMGGAEPSATESKHVVCCFGGL